MMTPEARKELHEFVTLRIHQLVCDHDSSYRKLSLELGKNESYIQKIMNTDALPSVVVLSEICSIFNMTLSGFFDTDKESTAEMARPISLMKNMSAERIHAFNVIMEGMMDKP